MWKGKMAKSFAVCVLFCLSMAQAGANPLQDKSERLFRFVQERQIAILSKPVLSSGFVYFNKKNGLCWHITEPYTSTLLVNEQGIQQLSQAGKKMLMKGGNPVFEAFSNVYLALFSGELTTLERHFAVESTVQNKMWTIDLKPKKESALSWLQSILISQTEKGNTLTLLEKNGDRSKINFVEVEGAIQDVEYEAIRCW